MLVLETKNLSKSYGKVKALDNLNLRIESGNIYGILGPNGSGKTTTLGIILGILKHDSGSFEWFGGQSDEKYRLRLGAILETPNFYPYLNAVQNLEIVQRIKGSKDDDVDAILDSVNLLERKKSKFRTFSLGMKQRLAIAATLIGNPDVVIFDEPTNGLDPQGIAEVRKVLQNVAESGRTVLLASHILDEVEKICTHINIIKNGKLLVSGMTGEILSTDLQGEIGAEDSALLLQELGTIPFISNVKLGGQLLQFQMEKSHTAAELNRIFHEKGIILNHLVVRKQKLEEEFLAITKNA